MVTTMNLRSGKKTYTALAFILPLAGLLVLRMICAATFSGTYSMLYSDMYHQYYPFFVAFRKALLSGDSLLYSWNVGMGMDYLGLIAYYLASPLNLLTVVLPESWVLGYFSFLMPLKLSLASLFFAILLKQLFGKDDFSIALFGCFYALCAWALGYQWNIMWLDSFALLPLVMLGMVRLLRERKFLLYTISLYFAICCNYYIGYFICLFVFLSFFCYEICHWQNWRKFFSDLLFIALFSLIAVGMTAFLTFPALSALTSTQSSVNKFPTGFKLNIADKNTLLGLLDAMRQVAGNANGNIKLTFKEGLPNLYCGIIANFLVFLFLSAKSIKLKEKLCCVFLLLFFNLSFVLRQLDYIWHGFHFTNMIPYRFSFLYSFVMLFMAYRAWIHRHEFRLLQIAAASLMSVALVFCSDSINPFFDLITGKAMILPWSTQENTLANLKTIMADCSYVLFNLVFIGAYTAALIYGQFRKVSNSFQSGNSLDRSSISTVVLWGIMGIELVILLTNFGIWFPGTNTKNYPKGTKDSEAIIEYMTQREADSLFYRAETTHSQTLNDGALNGYNGISTFTSSANVKVTEFMKALGFGAKNTYNRYNYEDSSPVANLFLNIKYMIDRDDAAKTNAYFDDVYQSGNVHLLENDAYLPLGFLTDAQILNIDFSSEQNPFLFQNELLRSASGINQDCWNLIPGYGLTILGSDVTLQSQNETGYCSFETFKTAGTITYRFMPDQEGLMCFHVDQSKRNNFSVYVNDAEEPLYTESYSLPQMLSICHVTPGDKVEIQFRCPSYQTGTVNLTAAILDDTVFQAAYATLASSPLVLTDFGTTRVSGTITCNQDGILYTSIPQDGNWSATVDGKPAQIVLIGNAMSGLNLSEGQHAIVFTYRNRAFALGWKISLACCLAFVGCVFLFYRPDLRHKKGKYEK